MSAQYLSQQALFPLDPWGAGEVFVVIDHPHPTIVRAMVGPLVLGRDRSPGEWRPQCIALKSNRRCLVRTSVDETWLFEPERLWDHVTHAIRADTYWDMGDDSDSVATGEDSILHWSSNAFWMKQGGVGKGFHEAVYRLSKLLAQAALEGSLCGETLHPLHHEHLATAQVEAQCMAAIQHLVHAMVPELQAAYARRPYLSTGMVNRLLSLTQDYGGEAARNMLQAIQTESVGLLHLMTLRAEFSAAAEILEAVCRGDSLPAKLKQLGISKSAHRLTLVKPEHLSRQTQLPPGDINSFSVTGPQWLEAMRLPHIQRVASLGDSRALRNTLAALQLLQDVQLQALNNQTLSSAVVEFCVKKGDMACCAVFKRLCKNARALMTGAQRIAQTRLTFEGAIGMAMKWEVTTLGDGYVNCHCDWTNPHDFLLVVCQEFGIEVVDVMRPIMKAHPGVPDGFKVAAGLALLPLDSLELTLFHGQQVGNCLGSFATMAFYIARGQALYSVRNNGVAIGTIALSCGTSASTPRVVVSEVSGLDDGPFNDRLVTFAQLLADKWNEDCERLQWIRYVTQCNRLSPV